MNNSIPELVLWTAIALVVHSYVGYPIIIRILSWIRPMSVDRFHSFTGTVSIVLVVHNEEQKIERRLDELTSLASRLSQPGEVIVVSDGSTDATVQLARKYENRNVRIHEIEHNIGKAAALTEGCAFSNSDVIVFADVRQRWDQNALNRLLCNFNDRYVGAVGGELTLEQSDGVMSGVGLYWRYEKWIRHNESLFYSTVGVSGAISAVRRILFKPIPASTMLDDVYWPLCVVMQGYRVVHDETAIAYDRLPDRPRDEFRRKIRTLSGNYQLLMLLPASVWPWRNPVWFQFVSHKILRLVAPWMLIAIFAISAFLPGIQYKVLFFLQCLFYGLGIAAMFRIPVMQNRFTSVAGSFLLLNIAAWLAFWVWVSGRSGKTWQKVRYGAGP